MENEKELSIGKERLEEIASQLIYGMIEDDKIEAYRFFRETLDLSKEECRYFDLNYEEIQNID